MSVCFHWWRSIHFLFLFSFPDLFNAVSNKTNTLPPQKTHPFAFIYNFNTILRLGIYFTADNQYFLGYCTSYETLSQSFINLSETKGGYLLSLESVNTDNPLKEENYFSRLIIISITEGISFNNILYYENKYIKQMQYISHISSYTFRTEQEANRHNQQN